MTMSDNQKDNLAGTFLEIARMHYAKQQRNRRLVIAGVVQPMLFCDACGCERPFVFARQDGRHELFRCTVCHVLKDYTTS